MFGLIELLEVERKDWSQQVLGAAADHFERRLAEELSLFRHEVVREMATTRVEMLKWSFLFWIAQVAAIVGLLAYTRR